MTEVVNQRARRENFSVLVTNTKIRYKFYPHLRKMSPCSVKHNLVNEFQDKAQMFEGKLHNLIVHINNSGYTLSELTAVFNIISPETQSDKQSLVAPSRFKDALKHRVEWIGHVFNIPDSIP